MATERDRKAVGGCEAVAGKWLDLVDKIEALDKQAKPIRDKLVAAARELVAGQVKNGEPTFTLRFLTKAKDRFVDVVFASRAIRLKPEQIERWRQDLGELAPEILAEERAITLTGAMAQWFLDNHRDQIGRPDVEIATTTTVCKDYLGRWVALQQQAPKKAALLAEIATQGLAAPSVKPV